MSIGAKLNAWPAAALLCLALTAGASKGAVLVGSNSNHPSFHQNDRGKLTRPSSRIGKIAPTSRSGVHFMNSADRRNVQFQLAQHYGRKCRGVFPHGDWTQHEANIASGWTYMAREFPWEQAREAVHEGWEMVDFDGRSLLFSAINDNADDDPQDGTLAFQ